MWQNTVQTQYTLCGVSSTFAMLQHHTSVVGSDLAGSAKVSTAYTHAWAMDSLASTMPDPAIASLAAGRGTSRASVRNVCVKVVGSAVCRVCRYGVWPRFRCCHWSKLGTRVGPWSGGRHWHPGHGRRRSCGCKQYGSLLVTTTPIVADCFESDPVVLKLHGACLCSSRQ